MHHLWGCGHEIHNYLTFVFIPPSITSFNNERRSTFPNDIYLLKLYVGFSILKFTLKTWRKWFISRVLHLKIVCKYLRTYNCIRYKLSSHARSHKIRHKYYTTGTVVLTFRILLLKHQHFKLILLLRKYIYLWFNIVVFVTKYVIIPFVVQY